MTVISFDSTWFIHNLRFDPELFSPFREMGKHYMNLIPATTRRWISAFALFEPQKEHVGNSGLTVVYSLLLQFWPL